MKNENELTFFEQGQEAYHTGDRARAQIAEAQAYKRELDLIYAAIKHTAQEIDAEVKRILTEAHAEARRLLTESREALETVTRQLLKKEVMEGSELRALLDLVAGPAAVGLTLRLPDGCSAVLERWALNPMTALAGAAG